MFFKNRELKYLYCSKDFNFLCLSNGILLLLVNLFEIVIASLYGKLIELIGGANRTTLIITGITLLSIYLIKYILDYYTYVMLENKKMRLLHISKMKIYNKYLNKTLYISKSGEVLENLTNDFNQVGTFFINLRPEVIVNIISVILYCVFLSSKSLLVMIILFAISLLQIVPPYIVRKFMSKNYDSAREWEAKITDCIINAYKGFQTIKVYGLEKWYLGRLKKIHKSYLKVGNNQELLSSTQASLSSFLEGILKYGTYIILGTIFIYEKVPLIGVVEGIAISESFYFVMKSIFNAVPKYSVTKTAAKRLGKIINITDINEESFHITISDEIHIITGPNGSGKTTFLKQLITMPHVMNQTQELNINIKGSDESNFLYIAQKDPSFSFSAKELYDMSSYIVDSSSCEKFAYKFGLTKDLLYKKQIKELSDGEKKKVFLSLAFASKKEVLILDEPTNGLDKVGVNQLINLIHSKQKKTLIVSHNESILALGNKVWHMEGGEIYDIKGF